jgi:hypothetical protein
MHLPQLALASLLIAGCVMPTAPTTVTVTQTADATATMASSAQAAQAQGYPWRFLLNASEIPFELQLGPASSEVGKYMGLSADNPGRVDAVKASRFAAKPAAEAWAEVLQVKSNPNIWIVWWTIRFTTTEDVDTAMPKVQRDSRHAVREANGYCHYETYDGIGPMERDSNVLVSRLSADQSETSWSQRKPYADSAFNSLKAKHGAFQSWCVDPDDPANRPSSESPQPIT